MRRWCHVLMLPLVAGLYSACGGGGSNHEPQTPSRRIGLPPAGDNPVGYEVYVTHCKLCHGVDGRLGGSGAANLALSLLTVDEADSVITNGRRLMQPFADRLSAGEIRAVARYIQAFRETP